MLANGSATIKPAKSGRFSANQLAKAIKAPANAALSKISMQIISPLKHSLEKPYELSHCQFAYFYTILLFHFLFEA